MTNTYEASVAIHAGTNELICPECGSFYLYHMGVNTQRNALIIDFACESCSSKLSLALSQNKGCTQIYWLREKI